MVYKPTKKTGGAPSWRNLILFFWAQKLALEVWDGICISGYDIHSSPWKDPPIFKNGKPSISIRAIIFHGKLWMS